MDFFSKRNFVTLCRYFHHTAKANKSQCKTLRILVLQKLQSMQPFVCNPSHDGQKPTGLKKLVTHQIFDRQTISRNQRCLSAMAKPTILLFALWAQNCRRCKTDRATQIVFSLCKYSKCNFAKYIRTIEKKFSFFLLIIYKGIFLTIFK